MRNPPDILKRILRRKAEEVVERSQALPLRELSARIEHMPPARDFHGALEARIAAGHAAVIAEVKRAAGCCARISVPRRSPLRTSAPAPHACRC